MNEHIELVKKWLDNPDSVSQKEREENYEAAYEAVDWAAATWAADRAAYRAAKGDVEGAKYWVERYEELVK